MVSDTLRSYLIMIEVIHLVYSFSSADNAVRKLSLLDKLLSVVPIHIVNSFNYVLEPYPNNPAPITWPFILGLFIGDGNFYIRIRHSITGFQFIPV